MSGDGKSDLAEDRATASRYTRVVVPAETGGVVISRYKMKLLSIEQTKALTTPRLLVNREHVDV